MAETSITSKTLLFEIMKPGASSDIHTAARTNNDKERKGQGALLLHACQGSTRDLQPAVWVLGALLKKICHRLCCLAPMVGVDAKTRLLVHHNLQKPFGSLVTLQSL